MHMLRARPRPSAGAADVLHSHISRPRPGFVTINGALADRANGAVETDITLYFESESAAIFAIVNPQLLHFILIFIFTICRSLPAATPGIASAFSRFTPLRAESPLP